ncbi:MAG: DUF2085 domain-containing protein [bacterium]
MAFWGEWYQSIFTLCSFICHQIPLKSFFIFGWQLPLCARCTGLLVGSLIFLITGSKSYRLSVPAAILLTLPMLLDVGTQMINLWQGHNFVRLATGLGFGAAFPSILWIFFITKIRTSLNLTR